MTLLRHASRFLVAPALLACALLLLHATPVEALDPNTDAIVRADGDCLRLRAQPTTAGTTLTCIPEGSRVRVLSGNVNLDGFRWQRISFGGQEGWSVEQYLVAAGTSSPAPTATAAATPPPAASQPAPAATAAPAPPAASPSLIGSVPTSAGFGLAVWGGGAIDRIPSVATPLGCQLRAIWQTRSGEFIGYVYGAPGIVNASWNAQFVDGSLPASTPLILVCGGSGLTPPAAAAPSTPPGPVATPSLPSGTPNTPPGPAGNG